MPFQSEKQRKYLWANEPAIAKRWEKYPKGYNTGGVSHLFRSKYDAGDLVKKITKRSSEDQIKEDIGKWLKEKGVDLTVEEWRSKPLKEKLKLFLWKFQPFYTGELEKGKDYNSGGYVRPEEDGVLGLADGGRIGFPGGGGTEGGYQDDWSTGAETTNDDGGNDGNDYGAGDPNQFNMTPPSSNDGGVLDYESGSPENTWATMSDEMKNKSKAETERILGDHGDPMGSPDEQAKYARYVKYTVKNQAPPKKKSFLGALATGIAWYTGLAPLLGLKVPAVVQTLGTGFKMKKQLDYGVKEYNKRFGTNYSFDEFIAKTTDHLKKEHAERKEKMALYKSLPDGHPEKIALSVELQIGKKPEHLGDGDNIDITYENIEETNDLKEKVRASGETMDLLYAPEKEDRSKQIAYWQSLMAPYMGGAMGMAAEGGRVPGYNTGGLSSLFRLKNK